jgi:hypothetical protein
MCTEGRGCTQALLSARAAGFSLLAGGAEVLVVVVRMRRPELTGMTHLRAPGSGSVITSGLKLRE